MNKVDIELIDSHGWDVICEFPLEIQHRDSGAFADGIVASMTLQMIKDGAVSFKKEKTCMSDTL